MYTLELKLMVSRLVVLEQLVLSACIIKSLNVMGDGGMVVTNNKKIATWLRKYRNHGMINRDILNFGE